MAIGDAAFSSGDVMRRLHQIEAELREMRSARRLENATIGSGGVRVAGGGAIRSTSFDGDLTKGDPGNVGWALGNDMLALGGQLVTPLELVGRENYTDNFSITATETVRASTTIAVPSWADQVLVQATASAGGLNGSGSNSQIGARTSIAGVTGIGFGATGVPSGATTLNVSHMTVHQQRLFSTSGSSFTVSALMWTSGSTWPVSTSNFCQLSVIAIFKSN